MEVVSYSEIKSFNDHEKTMKHLAYDILADDPWRVLGLPKFGGPHPNRDMVEGRVREGILLAGVGALRHKSWPFEYFLFCI